jgi:hypothetical protein
MKHIKLFEGFLNETIRASEAYRDEGSINTVIQGRRKIGFQTLVNSLIPEDVFWQVVDAYGLKTIEVPSSKHKAYIFFKPGQEAEANAAELRDIAEKYGGYLAWNASMEDTRRIGELLEYDENDIDEYIRERYNEDGSLKNRDI